MGVLVPLPAALALDAPAGDALSRSSLEPKYPLPLPLAPPMPIPVPALPVRSRPKDARPRVLLLPLCDPLGLRVKGGVSLGLVVRLASRDTEGTERSGNGSTLGLPLDGDTV